MSARSTANARTTEASSRGGHHSWGRLLIGRRSPVLGVRRPEHRVLDAARGMYRSSSTVGVLTLGWFYRAPNRIVLGLAAIGRSPWGNHHAVERPDRLDGHAGLVCHAHRGPPVLFLPRCRHSGP